MTRHALLNNVEHKDLRVVFRYGAEYGDNSASVATVPTEFADVQREYPIFLRKDSASGEYQAIALLGFEKGENLFISGDRWNAFYLPGMVARGPFLIGIQERQVSGEMRTDRNIHVDLDHPRVSFTEGEPVFLPQGGNSPMLNQVASILRGISDGLEVGKAMYAALAAHDLIEPMTLEVKVTPQHNYKLDGLHSVSVDKLRDLGQEALYGLHRSGYLHGAFLLATSVGNIRKLIAMKQARLRNQNPVPPGAG